MVQTDRPAMDGTLPCALPLAISIGDPSGIGPDTLLLAWRAQLEGNIAPLPPFVLVCDPVQLHRRAHELGIELNVCSRGPGDRYKSKSDSNADLQVIDLKNPLVGAPARPCREDAPGIVDAIRGCVDLIRSGEARAMVTLPINKKALYDAGFDYPGHTEFLGAAASEFPGVTDPIRPVMMLASDKLRAIPVTVHIPLRNVADTLTTTDIVETARIAAGELKLRFGIASPRLAISGLNPHAGEGGALGLEDESIIVPAIAQLKSEGVDCFGPLPADTMFHKAARTKYDVALCMYHDQALIPAKALAFDETVNVTLGLPFVRTSPDHGTAYDIAGTGRASPASTIAAIRLADLLSRNCTTETNPDQEL